MRNPNGYGGITKLPGNRRNPFRVRITTGWEYDEKTGRHKQNYATLGYYPTQKDARIALAAYNANPYDVDVNKITFAETYNNWLANSKITESMQRSYRAAYKHLDMLHNMRMRDIKKLHLQNALDANAGRSTVYLSKMRALIKNVIQYAIDNDIIDKDYSKNLIIAGEDKAEGIHKPYTSEEIKLLWDNLNLPVKLSISRKEHIEIYPVDTILIYIYTGMRPGELFKVKCSDVNIDEHYLVGGIKNESSKNRIIPLHDEIMPLITKRVESGNEYLVPYKVNIPPTLNQYSNYFFHPVMRKLGINHLPHDGRHTFATFADKYIEDKFMIKRILGHSIDDITQKVYTHKKAAELVAAVNKIKFTK